MAAVPLDRLLLETDCPWCEIRPSHAGKLLRGGAAWLGAEVARTAACPLPRFSCSTSVQAKSSHVPACQVRSFAFPPLALPANMLLRLQAASTC